jgi:two-component system response regulator WspF
MRQAGFLTVAQDAKTSVIDGMPKAARDLGAASRVLPLADIGPNLSQWLLGQCAKVTTEPLFFRESD